MANTYKCSDGSRVTQGQIDYQLRKSKDRMAIHRTFYGCHAYPDKPIVELQCIDHDHTISVARCKALGKTELIWDVCNMVYNDREAHREWESYRSGRFEDHQNVFERMMYVLEHDREGFEKRMQHLSNHRLIERLRGEEELMYNNIQHQQAV